MCDCLIISLGDEGFAIISDCSCNVYTSINQATSNNSGPSTHKRGHFGIFFQLLSVCRPPLGSLLISRCAQNIVARVHLPFTVAIAVAVAVAIP